MHSRLKIEHILIPEYTIYSTNNLIRTYPSPLLQEKEKKKRKKIVTNITFLKLNITHLPSIAQISPLIDANVSLPPYSSCETQRREDGPKVATIKIQGNKSLDGGF